MAALYKLSDKAKATLILVASILASLTSIVNHLVKIFDDSELTVAEAVEFTTSEGGALVGKWHESRLPKP